MEIASVNLGRREILTGSKWSGETGIRKAPVGHAVRVSSAGVEGDAVVDMRHHGGPDQAVYVYGLPDYRWWSERLGRELGPGTFGDNLTIEGLESAALNIGDRLVAGSVVLEVTAPRIPCGTLAARMGSPSFVNRFRDGERPGVYCRVIQEGFVSAGDAVGLDPYAGATVSVLAVYRDFFEPELSEAAIRRFLEAPIAVRAREHKEKQLARVISGR